MEPSRPVLTVSADKEKDVSADNEEELKRLAAALQTESMFPATSRNDPIDVEWLTCPERCSDAGPIDVDWLTFPESCPDAGRIDVDWLSGSLPVNFPDVSDEEVDAFLKICTM